MTDADKRDDVPDLDALIQANDRSAQSADEQDPASEDSASESATSEGLTAEGQAGEEVQAEDDNAAANDAAGVNTPVAKTTPKTSARPLARDQDVEEGQMDWYILKVAFNREESIRDALEKRVKMEGMEEFFGDIVVPTEDLVEFTRAGKRRIVKRKLLPGYLMVNMVINDDTWFLVRETGGISDFTGAAGKPMPMDPADIERFVKKPEPGDDEEVQLKTAIPFKVGDRVRVKEGNFQNQEGEIDGVDEANGRITVIINIFGRSVPMELDHWQVEEL